MEKIWIYQLNRLLQPEEEQEMQPLLDTFVSQWDAHGQLLAAGAEIRFKHFVILRVNVKQTPPSGCSVDSSVRFLKQLESQFDLQLFDRLMIACLIDEQVQLFSKSSLKDAYKEGRVDDQTLFFNNLVDRYDQLEAQWLIPLHQSWVYPFLQKP
jgi:hypothetical protein